MKVGILTFSYTGFSNFRDNFSENGFYNVNLGDFCQTIAMRNFLLSIGVRNSDIVEIDRDTLSTYEGPEIYVIMNAMMPIHSLPTSKNIKPVFLGFSARSDVLDNNIDYLRRNQPIGCRDVWTAEYLNNNKVETFVTGCITLTFPKIERSRSSKNLFVVYGDYAGKLPSTFVDKFNLPIFENIEFLYNRAPVFEFPLSVINQLNMRKYSNSILEKIKQNASHVLTPLHHIAAPCLAFGIPVLLYREFSDQRFSYLDQIIRIKYKEDNENIRIDDFQEISDRYKSYTISIFKSVLENIIK